MHSENTFNLYYFRIHLGLPTWCHGKESACHAGDLGSFPWSGRSPGVGDDNPLSILDWKMSWTEKPGRLRSMGLQRVRHDSAQHNPGYIYLFLVQTDTVLLTYCS